MTLKEFDATEAEIARLECESNALRKRSRVMEQQLFTKAGIVCVNRDPGFPCWTTESIMRYYNTPREALLAKLKNEEMT